MYALAFTLSKMSNQEKQGVKIENLSLFAKKKKKTWITVRFLFDVEHAGSSIEKRVGHKCTVGRLVLVLPLLVTHVARVGAVEEEKHVTDIMFLFTFDVLINIINHFSFIVKLHEEKVKF